MSTNGVPSRTSRLETLISLLLISKITASCIPIGFGLSGDLVAKTPVISAWGLFLGLVVKVSLLAWCNQVNNMTPDPAFKPETACRYSGSITNTACGAPSFSCNGQSFSSFNEERIWPMNFIDSILQVSIAGNLRINNDRDGKKWTALENIFLIPRHAITGRNCNVYL